MTYLFDQDAPWLQYGLYIYSNILEVVQGSNAWFRLFEPARMGSQHGQSGVPEKFTNVAIKFTLHLKFTVSSEC